MSTLVHGDDVALHNLQAEEATLAGLITDAGYLGEISQLLEPRDFYFTNHKIVYRTLLEMYSRGERIDVVTVPGALSGALFRDGFDVFGEIYRWCAETPTATGTPSYAAIVKRLSTNRQIVELGEQIKIVGYDDTLTVDELVGRVHDAIGRLVRGAQRSGFVSLTDVLSDYMDVVDARAANPGTALGVPSGIYDLDKLTGGFQPGQLVILGALPGHGKSAWSAGVVRAASKAGKTVAVFSMEMDAEQVAERLLCQEGALDSARLRLGYLSEDEWARLISAAGNLSERKIYINDSRLLSVPQMQAMLRALHDQTPVDLVVVDYLQLVTPTHRGGESRVQEVDAICKGLRAIAQELRCPVITPAQIRRDLDDGSEPENSDLRESGGIEQTADIVMFLHRYDRDDPRKVNLLLKKHRNGPLGKVGLFWIPTYTRFENVAVRSVSGAPAPRSSQDATDDDDSPF